MRWLWVAAVSWAAAVPVAGWAVGRFLRFADRCRGSAPTAGTSGTAERADATDGSPAIPGDIAPRTAQQPALPPEGAGEPSPGEHPGATCADRPSPVQSDALGDSRS